MAGRFPPIEPYAGGLLDVGDGHHIYWECCGNPQGKPAIYLHGGPGSGASPGQRRFFDPEAYKIVIFDQRGCGRSRPLAGEPLADLSANTTQHLIADIERLRVLLDVERWTVLGLSWGTTLALAYAQTHRERVDALVLGFVTATTPDEVDWITVGVGRIFPQEWDAFRSFVPPHLRHLRLVDAYATLLSDPDPAIHNAAARAWCNWEDAHVSLTPGHQPSPHYADPIFSLGFARLVTHYWRNSAFFTDDELIEGAAALDGIPGVLIHGRFDVSGPLVTAWRLSKVWPTSRLIILDDAGHGGGEDVAALIADTLTEFARPVG